MIILMETGSAQEEIDMMKKRIREESLGSMFRRDGERVLIHVPAGAPDNRPRVIEVLSGKSPSIVDEQRVPCNRLVY